MLFYLLYYLSSFFYIIFPYFNCHHQPLNVPNKCKNQIIIIDMQCLCLFNQLSVGVTHAMNFPCTIALMEYSNMRYHMTEVNLKMAAVCWQYRRCISSRPKWLIAVDIFQAQMDFVNSRYIYEYVCVTMEHISRGRSL